MLRRCAGDCYSQSRAICRHLRHIAQFARVPKERLPACGVSAEYFPQFHGSRRDRGGVARHRAAAQKSRSGRMPFRPLITMSQFCPWFAATESQAAYRPLKSARVVCKHLSLLEIRSKNLVSCHGFALACPPFGRKGVSEIARSAGMQLKRFSCNAILSAAREAARAKF
jgi:hypothetical protein